MSTILAFAFVLGVLILVHESGHFFVAKKIGVRVEKFSLGFGPKLVGFRKGETEYLISAFPLGGYVKLAGENPGEDEITGQPWEFASRSVLERFRIVAFGPIMNVVLAVFLMIIVFMLGRQIPEYLDQSPVIGWVEEKSAAEKSGLQINDNVLSVNNIKIKAWEDFLISVAGNGSKSLKIKVARNGRQLELSVKPQESAQGEMDGIGVYPHIPPKIGIVTPDYPADKAGLKVGDVISSINGEKIYHWFQLSEIIHHSYGQELAIGVEREYGHSTVNVTPRKDTLKGGIGIIGIQSVQKMIVRKYSLGKAISSGFKEIGKLLNLTVDFFKNLLIGRISTKSIGGPIAIAQIAGSAAESGQSDLFYFMSFLSIQLGVLNLMPIPILDGGHLFFLIVEALRGRPLSLKHREIAQQIGLTVILMLMLIAFYNDIARVLG
ncbi:MAG: RIP metalloprotease RseP [Candidatus Schekmanbacteria bacterium]|nr:RIP metalloprotease RseP [Candidatus Schekmanbacteria bacterium]